MTICRSTDNCIFHSLAHRYGLQAPQDIPLGGPGKGGFPFRLRSRTAATYRSWSMAMPLFGAFSDSEAEGEAADLLCFP